METNDEVVQTIVNGITNLSEELMDEMYSELPSDTQADSVASAPEEERVVASELNGDFSYKQRLYENVLAPELKENEKLKRKQKQELMKRIFQILAGQFFATYGFVLIIIIIIASSKQLELSDTIIGKMIDFIQFYITSIIAELIAILFFIVKDVFDKSIFELFRNFDSKGKEEKDKQ